MTTRARLDSGMGTRDRLVTDGLGGAGPGGRGLLSRQGLLVGLPLPVSFRQPLSAGSARHVNFGRFTDPGWKLQGAKQELDINRRRLGCSDSYSVGMQVIGSILLTERHVRITNATADHTMRFWSASARALLVVKMVHPNLGVDHASP